MTTELTRDNFDTEVLESRQPVLIDFWGPQCGPCLALNPFVAQLESEYQGKVRVAKVNAAENRMLCVRLKVLGLPTFLLYKNGEEIERITANDVSEDSIRRAIEAVL